MEPNATETLREVVRELCDLMTVLPPLTSDEADRTCRILDRLSEELAEVAGDLRARS
jgi:hypothetical protein